MTRGTTFFLRTIQTHYIDDAKGVLLEEASRAMDLIDELAARKDAKAISEVRQHRLVLGRLLAQLDLGPEYNIITGRVVEGNAQVLSPTSVRARKAARARWAGHVKRAR